MRRSQYDYSDDNDDSVSVVSSASSIAHGPIADVNGRFMSTKDLLAAVTAVAAARSAAADAENLNKSQSQSAKQHIDRLQIDVLRDSLEFKVYHLLSSSSQKRNAKQISDMLQCTISEASTILHKWEKEDESAFQNEDGTWSLKRSAFRVIEPEKNDLLEAAKEEQKIIYSPANCSVLVLGMDSIQKFQEKKKEDWSFFTTQLQRVNSMKYDASDPKVEQQQEPEPSEPEDSETVDGQDLSKRSSVSMLELSTETILNNSPHLQTSQIYHYFSSLAEIFNDNPASLSSSSASLLSPSKLMHSAASVSASSPSRPSSSLSLQRTPASPSLMKSPSLLKSSDQIRVISAFDSISRFFLHRKSEVQLYVIYLVGHKSNHRGELVVPIQKRNMDHSALDGEEVEEEEVGIIDIVKRWLQGQPLRRADARLVVVYDCPRAGKQVRILRDYLTHFSTIKNVAVQACCGTSETAIHGDTSPGRFSQFWFRFCAEFLASTTAAAQPPLSNPPTPSSAAKPHRPSVPSSAGSSRGSHPAPPAPQEPRKPQNQPEEPPKPTLPRPNPKDATVAHPTYFVCWEQSTWDESQCPPAFEVGPFQMIARPVKRAEVIFGANMPLDL